MDINHPPIAQARSAINFDLTLEYYGSDGRLPPGNVYGPVLDSVYLLQYCSMGRGVFEVDGITFALKSGDCMVTFPGQTHIERADERDPWALTWIALSGKSAASFFSKLDITPSNPLITHCEQSSIPLLLQEIVEAADTVGFQRDFLLGARLFEFFDECSRRQTAAAHPNMPVHARDSYVAQATYYLDMHYSRKNITIKSLAENIGLNRSYLYEIFKEKTGLSPQEYLTRLRVNKACEFLLLPQATVASVAYSIGYEPSVFSKAFKRVMGITPIEYKQKYSP